MQKTFNSISLSLYYNAHNCNKNVETGNGISNVRGNRDDILMDRNPAILKQLLINCSSNILYTECSKYREGL